MKQIAWIVDNIYIYWQDVILALAVAAAVCTFLALQADAEEKPFVTFPALLLAIVFSVLLSRLAQWYFRPESYAGLQMVWDLRIPGPMALLGAFFGCGLAAGVTGLVLRRADILGLLDRMSLTGALGIGIGRLACFFNTSDRGMVLDSSLGLPWVIATRNQVSGAEEYRLATFLFQSGICGLIFLILLSFYLVQKKGQNLQRGDTALLFLMLYGASQVVLDSTRYDSLYLRSNGFVSVVQVLSAFGLVLTVVVFAVRLVRAGGWKLWYGGLWFLQAGCLAVAGYMEYYVQRHGHEAEFAYSIMGIALLGIILSALFTRSRAAVEERNHDAWLLRIRRFQKEDA